MGELKLYSVYHMGATLLAVEGCKSTEDALMQCFGARDHAKIKETQQSCRVEEVTVPGYEIVIRKL